MPRPAVCPPQKRAGPPWRPVCLRTIAGMRFSAPGPTAALRHVAVFRAAAWVAASQAAPALAWAAGDANGGASASPSSPWPLALAAVAAGGWAWQAWQNRAQRAALQMMRVERLALADTLDVWQWRSDAQHRLIDWRPPTSADAQAWQPAAATGQLLWALFEAEDGPGLQTRLNQHASLPGLTVRVPLLGGAGSERQTVQLRATPLTDARGQFAGHIGTVRWLGSHAEAPPADEGAATTMAHEPPADKDHESFIYTVSHDLRAPIRVVEGFTRILKEDYGRLLDRVGNDHLDRVLGAAARMNSMIDALLALSQLSTQPLARQPVNLSQLAGFIFDDLKRQSPERMVTVHVSDGLHTQGDPTLLRLVLENLLGNAWKYTGKCACPEVWFGIDPEDPAVYMVRDNGAGFDMRFADRLFGVFQRLHSASDFQGTGVGLASVRRIVRRHGGEVWAESEVGRGAVFRFTLAPSATHKLAERPFSRPAKRS
jgi:signal transduction histidine kinase